MATNSAPGADNIPGVAAFRRNWYWLVLLGVIQLIIGGIGLGASVLMTEFSVMLLGCLLLAAGVGCACNSFMQKQWGSFFCDIMTAVLYLVVGAMVIENPMRAAEALTLLIAFFLIIGGLFRIVASLAGQFHRWGWVFINGLVTLCLGIMIWRQWPVSALWLIGTFVGIEMIFYGWSLVMLGLAAKRLPA